MRALIPNAFTMGNLVCGCLSIWYLFSGEGVVLSAMLIGIAAVLDVFDGLFARLLNVAGPLGKQLDSLADAVTFGIAPTLMALQLATNVATPLTPEILTFSPILLAVASVYRLGKFNVDTSQGDQFKGLPTPANALFWVAVCLMFEQGVLMAGIIQPYTIALFVLLLSGWMVSSITMLALKFKSLGWGENIGRYLFLLCSILVVCFCKIAMGSYFMAVPIILLLYLLISLWDERRKKKHEISR